MGQTGSPRFTNLQWSIFNNQLTTIWIPAFAGMTVRRQRGREKEVSATPPPDPLPLIRGEGVPLKWDLLDAGAYKGPRLSKSGPGRLRDLRQPTLPLNPDGTSYWYADRRKGGRIEEKRYKTKPHPPRTPPAIKGSQTALTS